MKKLFTAYNIFTSPPIIMLIALFGKLLLLVTAFHSLQSFSEDKSMSIKKSANKSKHPCNIKTYENFIIKTTAKKNQKQTILKQFKDKYGYSCDLQYANLKAADLRWMNLQYANLKEADIRWANLNNTNLSSADLRGANFRGADMREADLRSANLKGTKLRWADLRGTDFEGADMREAYLRWSDMSKANLRKANLKGANLREADLREADLREADLRDTYLRGIDLKKITLNGAIYDSKTVFPADFYFWTPWLKRMVKN